MRGVHGKTEQRHDSIPTARFAQGHKARPVVALVHSSDQGARIGERRAENESLDEGGRMRRTPEQSPMSTPEGPRRTGTIRRPSTRLWWEMSSSSAWSSWCGIMRVGDLMRLDGTPEMRSLTGSG